MAGGSHDRLGKLMQQLTEGLKPFVETRLETVYKLDWTDYAKAEWRDGALRWDLSGLFGTIIDQWNPVFSHSLRPADRSLIHELRDYRNRWAHQEVFTSKDVYRAFDDAERLLASTGSPLAAAVEQQRLELLKISHDEEQARLRQEQETEEREQREREQRRIVLDALLPVHLSNSQGEIVQAVHSILQREQGLNKITTTEVTDCFQRMLRSNFSKTEVEVTRSQRVSSPKSASAGAPTDGGIEVHGVQRVIEALEAAGYQTELFQRTVLRVHSEAFSVGSDPFLIRVISATTEGFNISKKYQDIRDGLLAFVWYVNIPTQATIYAMTYEEALDIANKKGWTRTNSWQVGGAYSTTKPDRTLRNYLKPYAMTPDKWRITLSRTVR